MKAFYIMMMVVAALGFAASFGYCYSVIVDRFPMDGWFFANAICIPINGWFAYFWMKELKNA